MVFSCSTYIVILIINYFVNMDQSLLEHGSCKRYSLGCVSFGNVLKSKMLATATCDNHYRTCLGHLGWHDTNRIISILFHAAQGGQGKYSSDCRMSLLPPVLLTNFVNVSCSLQGSKEYLFVVPMLI